MGNTNKITKGGEKMKKSGNVTIRLGPREVERILADEPLPRFHHRPQTVEWKLFNAVAKKFSGVEKDMLEKIRARNLCYEIRSSIEWQELSKSFLERRREVDEQYTLLADEEMAAKEKLTQAKFDEVGIVGFKAQGYSVIEIVKEEL